MYPVKTYINLINLTQLSNWSVRGLLDNKFNYSQKFEVAKIADFLVKSKEIVNINNDQIYRRITVRISNKGVVLRDTQKGINIGTKKQYIARAGQFIVSKIDARNGAFGIIPSELDGAIVTNDFPVFNVNTNRILPQFLLLITSTQHFLNFAQSCSSGTTNRQRMNIDLFLQQQIPLPSIEQQTKIVDAYNEKIGKATFLRLQSENIEIEIENYFLEQLGLATKFQFKTKTSGLVIVPYRSLERWDYFSTDARISNALLNANYPVQTIGSIYRFAKRSWNKKLEESKTFRYIEIGAIDPTKGILEAKEVLVAKAPSRATQIVKEGDLIVGTTRPYLKKFAIVSKDFHDNICSSGFAVFEPGNNYYLPYLMQFLRCVYGVEQLKNRMTGGLYPAITEMELREVRLPLPNLTIQREIMEKVKEREMSILLNKAQGEQFLLNAQLEFEKSIFD